MKRRGFFVRFILFLLLLAVLTIGGMLLYRVGWSQGYQTGLLVESSELGEALPLAPYFGGLAGRPFYPGMGFPFYGLCLGIGFIFLIMFLVGGILKPWGRRHWMGYSHPGKWKRGAPPPWADSMKEYHRELHSEEQEEGEQPESDA